MTEPYLLSTFSGKQIDLGCPQPDRAVFERADHTALLIEARVLLQDEGVGVRSQLKGKGVDLSSVTSARELKTPLTPGDAETQFLDAHVAAVADSAGTR